MIYAHKAYEVGGMLLKKLSGSNETYDALVVQLSSVSW